MIMECQASALSSLQEFCESDKHSILIEGPAGCGKTYLAKMFSNIKGCSDFISCSAKIDDIKNLIDSSYSVSKPIVICIENLDVGVVGSSYTLLKFLEEPSSNIYIVITCINSYNIPDTIISRCVTTSVRCPSLSDRNLYTQSKYNDKASIKSYRQLLNCCKSFKEIDSLFALSLDEVNYILALSDIFKFKESIGTISWNLSHFPSNKETPLNLVFDYLIASSPNADYAQVGINCADELTMKRMSANSVITRYLFDCKYAVS